MMARSRLLLSRVAEPVLLLLSLVGAVLAQNEPNCTWSSQNVTCHRLSLDDGSTLEHLSVAVDNCRDPVRVTLVMSEEGRCGWSFSVNGVGEPLRSQLQSGGQQLSVIFSRNTSHLHFQLLEDDGLNSTAVLMLDMPLNPAACMCESMTRAANSTTFPSTIPVSHACSVDGSDCLGFGCDSSIQLAGTYHSQVTIDPCTEVVTMNATDHSGNSVFQRNFSQSQALSYNIGVFPVTIYVYVIIEHYMYSMGVSVILNVGQGNATVLPSQQIILDRSSCGAQLPTFPGAPPSGLEDGYHCSNSNNEVSTTPPPPAGRTSLVVAVAVPITLVVVTVIVVVTVLFVLLAYIRMRKRREVRFRRMAFDVMEDDSADL